MIDSYFRTPYEKFVVKPLVSLPILKKVIPNLVTSLALVTGVLTLFTLSQKLILISFLLLILSGFLDTLDGSIARHLNKTSNFGAALDIFSDRIVETAVILGLFFFDTTRSIPVFCMLASSYLCVTSFLVVGIFSENASEKSFHYSPGIMERAEAFLFFVAMILFPYLFSYLAYAYSILVLLTALVRMIEFYKNTKI